MGQNKSLMINLFSFSYCKDEGDKTLTLYIQNWSWKFLCKKCLYHQFYWIYSKEGEKGRQDFFYNTQELVFHNRFTSFLNIISKQGKWYQKLSQCVFYLQKFDVTQESIYSDFVAIKETELKLFFFNLSIFNWRVFALQYCVDFCLTSISTCHEYIYIYMYEYVPSSQTSFPSPISSHLSRLSQSMSLSSQSHTAIPTGYFTYFTYGNIFYIW